LFLPEFPPKLEAKSIHGGQFQKTSGYPGIVQSTDEDIGIKGYTHRLSRAGTLLPVVVDQIHDAIQRDTTRCTAFVSFGQERFKAPQPLGFEPFQYSLTGHFVKSLMAARGCLLQRSEHRIIEANILASVDIGSCYFLKGLNGAPQRPHLNSAAVNNAPWLLTICLRSKRP
jgi:hypothetical protein